MSRTFFPVLSQSFSDHHGEIGFPIIVEGPPRVLHYVPGVKLLLACVATGNPSPRCCAKFDELCGMKN